MAFWRRLEGQKELLDSESVPVFNLFLSAREVGVRGLGRGVGLNILFWLQVRGFDSKRWKSGLFLLPLPFKGPRELRQVLGFFRFRRSKPFIP